jgi:hypothetical protein
LAASTGEEGSAHARRQVPQLVGFPPLPVDARAPAQRSATFRHRRGRGGSWATALPCRRWGRGDSSLPVAGARDDVDALTKSDEVGALTFLVVNAMNAADLRSWLSLPMELQVARFRVPPAATRCVWWRAAARRSTWWT